MRIACIGWGSLIWDKRELNVDDNWKTDGPNLPVEFARQSNNGRMTLVICEAKTVRTLWTTFNTNILDDAIDSLRKREQTTIQNIHSISTKGIVTGVPAIISEWLVQKGLDAAIWTGLRPKFNNADGVKPTLKEVIEYLKKLNGTALQNAKEYIQRTPSQIETEYRSQIVKELGW